MKTEFRKHWVFDPVSIGSLIIYFEYRVKISVANIVISGRKKKSYRLTIIEYSFVTPGLQL